MPIDIDELARLGRYQRRPQCLGGTDALQVPQKLTQRGALRAPPQPCLERMLAGIEPGEAVDTQQGGKKQRLQAVPKRLLPVVS